MRRHLARLAVTGVLGTLGGVLGTLTALGLSPPGRALLARNVEAWLTTAFRGQVEIGAVGGSLLTGVVLRDVTITGEDGRPFAAIPRLHADYRLPNLLAGRIVLSRITLVEPVISLVKYRSGGTNFHRIFRLGEGEDDGRPPPLVVLRGVRVIEGQLDLSIPWNPPPGATTAEAISEAVLAERALPGREIVRSADGLVRVLHFRRLSADLARVTISTPQDDPISLEVDSLGVIVSDPAVRVEAVAGRFEVRGDTLQFELSRGALPGSEFAGQGRVFWPEGDPRYAFQLSAPRLDLDDLRWLSDALPSMQGRSAIEARSPSPGRNEFTLSDLALAAGASRVTGEMTLLVEEERPLGFRALRLQLERTDVELFRGFLDTMPLRGTLTGPMTADGWLDDLRARVDWQFADARLPDRPETRLAGQGTVRLGGDDGLVFAPFALTSSSLWLPTLRQVAPTVLLEGRVAAVGTLEGPWRRATFSGDAVHRDGTRPESRVSGTTTLDLLQAEAVITADLRLAPLAFEGIRAGYPTFPSQGSVTGDLSLRGTMARMRVDGTLRGDLGELEAHGWFALEYPERWGGDSAVITFRDLDLAVLAGRGPPTMLAGRLEVNGMAGPPGAMPAGELELTLGPSRVRSFSFDSARVVAGVRDSVIVVDSLAVLWPRGTLTAQGRLGWASAAGEELTVALEAETVRPFDNLLHELTGTAPDSLSAARPLTGSVRGELTLAGSWDSLEARGNALLLDYAWRDQVASAVDLTFRWARDSAGGSGAATLAVPDLELGGDRYGEIDATVSGRPDSVRFAGGAVVGEGSRVAAAGLWQGASRDSFDLRLDSLSTLAGVHRWRLQQPVTLSRHGDALALSPVEFAAVDGAGYLRTTGQPPSATPGDMTLEAVGVPIRDLLALLQADTTGRAGLLGAELEIGGTRAAPLITGSVSLSDVLLADLRAPYLQGVLSYEDRRLFANLLLWKTGTRVVEVNASLPLDLALQRVAERRLAGPLEVRAVADSVDLAVFEAFTPSIRELAGLLTADVAVQGTWQRPELDGHLAIEAGAARVPGLGVRFSAITGDAVFDGDSMAVRRLTVAGEQGTLEVGGAVRFENLTRPVLDLALESRQFRAINVRNYLTLDATGELQLRGPVFGATLTGRLLAESGQLYFADLVQKDIINLEDPLASDLIDTTLIRQQGLGAAFQSRFLDSLRISDLRLDVGQQFWLRSSEANIQVDGSVRVNKLRQAYRFDGTFNARRGTYVLDLGFVTRDFSVRRGTVRFFGTEDLNAELDIEAEHVVQPIESSEEIIVTAELTGTMLAPRLRLSSDVRPPLSETDLVSYLMFGRPTTNLTSAGGLANEQLALDAATSVLSTELERAVISDFGLPVDYIQIRPSLGANSQSGGTSSWQLAAGWQVGRKVFLTLNAGFCTISQVSSGAVGASVEYRFLTNWRTQLSIEPVLACYGGRQLDPLTTSGRYQVGLDLFWEKEY